jgi:AcrR family transcriptional regulator
VLPDDDPFLSVNSIAYADLVTDAAVQLIGERGLRALSQRAIAHWIDVTPQAVAAQYGSRARLLEVVLGTFAGRWVTWNRQAPWMTHLPVVRLPETPHEVRGCRVWFSLVEFAAGSARAGDDAPSGIIEWAVAEEREHVRRSLRERIPREPDDDDLDVVMALGQGLRMGLLAPVPTLDLERAKGLLGRHGILDR